MTINSKTGNRMPLVQLGQPGKDPVKGIDVHCDYCAANAVWYHWAKHIVARDAYACDAHVSLLNPSYGDGAW